MPFLSRSDDIYVASYPRSGTTWLQMIIYQLMTDGAMTFTHISEVSPFLELALRSGQNLDHFSSPRILKTHLSFRRVRTWPGKYIYITRDGRDVMVSYFHFHKTYFGYGKPFAAFFDDFLAGRVQYGSWFHHVSEWQAHASDPNILFIQYEDLARSFDITVKSIAAFCGKTMTNEDGYNTAQRCSLDFMREHEAKFEPQVEAWPGVQFAQPTGRFLRQGTVGGWKQYFTKQQEAAFEAALESNNMSSRYSR